MYVYCADTWCDSCGAAIMRDLEAEGYVPAIAEDSDHWPQRAGEKETDAPDHCASGVDCLEPIDLFDYGLTTSSTLYGAESTHIGALLSGGLTEEGVAYTLELLAEKDLTPYQSALHRLWREEFSLPDITDTADVYVVCVNLPGCLPEMEPYSVRGKDAAYDCARHELDDGDSMGYSRAEWASALEAGGATVPLESGYVVAVSPIASLDLPIADLADYLESV
jgi:hypothetical protein